MQLHCFAYLLKNNNLLRDRQSRQLNQQLLDRLLKGDIDFRGIPTES